MKIFITSLFLLKALCLSNAFGTTKEYAVGTGSEYKFYGEKNEEVNLSIYITSSSFTKLGVEYFFTTSGLFATQVWQQYLLGIKAEGLSLDAGYIQSSSMKNPEIMTKEFRENNDKGVKIEDFFFSKSSEIEKYRISQEKIEVPAGSIMATHYQKKRDEQTIDFWISDMAGPLGLVKLISKGGHKNQNYKIELVTLLKNVKAKINPINSVPLTEQGKSFLGDKK